MSKIWDLNPKWNNPSSLQDDCNTKMLISRRLCDLMLQLEPYYYYSQIGPPLLGVKPFFTY
ncbi:hypothetical protein BB561_000314 [Smittium simulii]|uniref:Uncharacterized protein n=1 Tax=Smittium simulii TaxID=133385 RepID=A0A2T9YZL2_9FUNG|nr:hypothetical protein BB561_000326 [Smittium simulii]PVU97785.1 hypothetical protein BB561_000314 [Smittium simulii]